ncbi:MAG: S-methyl-5'-thioinosine phosphorylase [Cellvibrionaceae bacterium]|nr:S-methyl-5'-thioinosine phosphorylase [Cellvibrionaceae bacterium]
MALAIEAEFCRPYLQSLGLEQGPGLALIGGSGLDKFEGAKLIGTLNIETPFGEAPVQLLQLANGFCLWFLPRHGSEHHLPPHAINYRANIWALKSLAVTDVLTVNAVGGISAAMEPGRLVIPDQVIDYSYGRDNSFFDGEHYPLDHIDFSEPFSEPLRQSLATALGEGLSPACYACTQGPRLESAAEIKRLANDGCDLVGMTLLPEAALAREAELNYAALCMVVNWGAGLDSKIITMDDIYAQLEGCVGRAKEIIKIFTGLYEV